MGHANIWIRKANEKKWQTIKDKSAWVNLKLQEDEPPVIITDEGLKTEGPVWDDANKRWSDSDL